ncbi:MAG: hypothetical protein HOE02_00420 [Candidatus Marinimicrobia bacterium]|nr:hypothetical protein [Candidatus Neomarinimicrobiota bacterium]
MAKEYRFVIGKNKQELKSPKKIIGININGKNMPNNEPELINMAINPMGAFLNNWLNIISIM